MRPEAPHVKVAVDSVKNFCYGLFRVRTASDFVEEMLMTQKFRWLAAFALLLAFGAGAVRAQEEQEDVSPPARASVELLPAPHAAPTAAAPHCAACRQGCASCACSGKGCARETPADATQNVETSIIVGNAVTPYFGETPADSTQYVVTTKMVYASPDGDCEEVMSPKVTVFGGQAAHFQCLQTPGAENGDIAFMIQVTKQDKQVRLDLGVEESKVCYYAPERKPGRMTSRVLTMSNVTLGKMKRIVFTKHANGSDASWAEVTVTALPAEADAEDSPLDCISDAIGDLIDTVADVATSLFGDDAAVEQAEFVTPVAAAPRAFPVAATAPCPAVQQCVAVEAAKKPSVRIHFDKDKRACVEMRDGDKCWKASAGQISVVAGDLVLEGDVRCESTGSSPEFRAESIKVPLAGSEIQVGR
jgi:hypothetical protein